MAALIPSPPAIKPAMDCSLSENPSPFDQETPLIPNALHSPRLTHLKVKVGKPFWGVLFQDFSAGLIARHKSTLASASKSGLGGEGVLMRNFC